jgi:hypothetical protein
MKKIITILTALVVCANSFAQAPNCLWANSAGGTSADIGYCIATDANGNVYVTGNFISPSITFGTITLTNASNGIFSDIFIVKYDALGNVLWANSAGSSADERGISLSADANGNVYLTGYFYSDTITFGTTTLTNVGGGDIFIAKYDAAGNELWAKALGGVNDDVGNCVSTDTSGNVYLTGYFKSATITFGATTLTNAGYMNIFLAKYDATGTVLWATSAGGTAYADGHSISTDASGNVYVTGYFQSDTITFGTITLPNTYIGYADIFIAKYAPNGTVLWAKSAGGTSDDDVRSVATDASGNVFVTGYFRSSTITFDTTILTNAGSFSYSDIFIAKYDTTGTLLWATSAGGTGFDEGLGIATDASGNVYITGTFGSANITFATTTLINTGGSDFFIVKYAPNGTVLLAMSEGGASSDYGNSVCTDASGNVYVTGYFLSPIITLGTTTLTNAANPANSMDFFIAKYGSMVTGVDELFGSNELSVSPNPATTTITLTIPKLINANITITNLTGKQVATYNLQNTSNKTIDISHLSEGVYFVTLKTDEEVVTKKVIKTN